MASFGVIILTSSQMLIGRNWFPLRTALVCAGLRSLSPGGIIFGPMFAIVLQGLIVSLAFIIIRKPLPVGIVSGFLVVVTSLLQGVFTKLIFYGASLWEIYLTLLTKSENLFHLQPGQGWTAVVMFFIVLGAGGSVAGAFGWRLGKSALAREREPHV